jgi:hypothetical protein
MERRREFAAAYLQVESYLELEHNERWAALGEYYDVKLLSDTPPKRSAEGILFDYLDPEEIESTTIWLGASEAFRRAGKRKV